MNLESFLLMRHEIVLTVALLIILIAELSTENKKSIINLSLFLFAAVTAIGFIPSAEGTLFGGMYQTSHLTVMMKNILNVGTLILFFQVADWIKKPEYQ